jgi:hypothetical protein
MKKLIQKTQEACCIVLSFSACRSLAQVTATDEIGRVLDGSAHLKSRDLVSQYVSIACYTLFVFLCAPPAAFLYDGRFS